MEFIDLDLKDGKKKNRKRRRRKKAVYRNGRKPDHRHRKRRKRKLVHRRKRKRQRSNRKTGVKRKCLIAAGILFALLFLGAGTFAVVRAAGKVNLRSRGGDGPELSAIGNSEPISEEEKEIWQEGWVRYQDKIYCYNADIMTFLIMGIDKEGEVVENVEGTDGGQADALFLAVMDPHKMAIEVIGINRNTMTDIEIYDEEGAYVTTTTAQIAVQHGFGDGASESCEYQRKAVSNLFYNLPIHGYAAVNMSAIAAINDAVGGVDVTVLEDLTAVDGTLQKGAQVHLMGESAFWYVKYRDTSEFGSANSRLARQKQYLTGFIDEAKKAVKADISTVIALYQAVLPMMVSDVTVDELLYLAPSLVEYRFDQDSFRMMEGETVQGKEFEEFYADEDALYQMIIEIFYEEVEIE